MPNDEHEYSTEVEVTATNAEYSYDRKTSRERLDRQVEIALESALLFAKGVSIPALAERVYDAEPDLVAQVQRHWTIDRLTWMLRRLLRSQEEEKQLVLPGFEGLPRRITTKEGKYARLEEATLIGVREFRSGLAKKHKQKSPRMAALDHLIEVMTSYARENREVTVKEVLAAEQAKRQQPEAM